MPEGLSEPGNTGKHFRFPGVTMPASIKMIDALPAIQATFRRGNPKF